MEETCRQAVENTPWFEATDGRGYVCRLRATRHNIRVTSHRSGQARYVPGVWEVVREDGEKLQRLGKGHYLFPESGVEVRSDATEAV